jgi:hypothetical protein
MAITQLRTISPELEKLRSETRPLSELTMTLHQEDKRLAADLAEALVEDRMPEGTVWVDREDGSEGFTEPAQDMYNELYDIIYTNLTTEK